MSSPTSAPSLPSAHFLALSNNIPHIKCDGTNWADFHNRFWKFMLITGRWGYFIGATMHPAPKDLDNPTTMETQEGLEWDREDAITSYLLSKCLPNDINLDIEQLPTTEEQWNAVCRTFTAKSDYAKTNLYQSFMDMRCPKGGNVRNFLNDLRTRCYELRAIDIAINDSDYKRTILHGIPEALAPFASTMLTHLNLGSKYTGKPVDLLRFIDLVSEEANRMKACCTPEGQFGKGKNGSQNDEALAVTDGNGKKCCKGKCCHCQKEGHWARECFTKKWEEEAAKAQATSQAQSSQAAQASTSTSKPENKLVGSANTMCDL